MCEPVHILSLGAIMRPLFAKPDLKPTPVDELPADRLDCFVTALYDDGQTRPTKVRDLVGAMNVDGTQAIITDIDKGLLFMWPKDAKFGYPRGELGNLLTLTEADVELIEEVAPQPAQAN